MSISIASLEHQKDALELERALASQKVEWCDFVLKAITAELLARSIATAGDAASEVDLNRENVI